MNKYFLVAILSLVVFSSCNNSKEKSDDSTKQELTDNQTVLSADSVFLLPIKQKLNVFYDNLKLEKYEECMKYFSPDLLLKPGKDALV